MGDSNICAVEKVSRKGAYQVSDSIKARLARCGLLGPELQKEWESESPAEEEGEVGSLELPSGPSEGTESLREAKIGMFGAQGSDSLRWHRATLAAQGDVEMWDETPLPPTLSREHRQPKPHNCHSLA